MKAEAGADEGGVRRPCLSDGCRSAHLAQLAGLDLVHEAAHGVGRRDEGAGLDASDRLADVLVGVRERLERKGGRIPVSAWIWSFTAPSVNVTMPQSVWWMRTISSVPRSRWLMTSERMASSLATPPALRMTCASPSSRPSTLAGSSRASMHASTATS